MSIHFQVILIGKRERYFEQQTLFTLDHIFRCHSSVSSSALPSFLFMFLCMSYFLSFLPLPLPFLLLFPCPFFSSLLGFSSFSISSFLLSFLPSFFLSFFSCFYPFFHPVLFAFLLHFKTVGVFWHLQPSDHEDPWHCSASTIAMFSTSTIGGTGTEGVQSDPEPISLPEETQSTLP